MAASTIFNRVKYTPASAGTGDFVTSAAVAGFRTPAGASIPDGTLVSYVAFNSTQSEWETGQGAYTVATTTVARTTVRESSNAGAKVNFTAAPTVAIDLQSQDIALYAPLISPSFTTPALGVATATSLAIGGAAAIGANALAVNGQITNAGGTITTSQPFTITQTWNAAGVTFNSLLIDITSTASAAASLLADFRVGGVSKVSIGKSGNIVAPGDFQINAGAGGDFFRVSFNNNGVVNGGYYGFGASGSGVDATVSRNAAGVSQFGTSGVNAAGSWLATSAGLGPTPAISASTMLNFSAGTTAISQMRFGASTAPTSPTDGDFWFDGTNVKIRVSGATKTFTLT